MLLNLPPKSTASAPPARSTPAAPPSTAAHPAVPPAASSDLLDDPALWSWPQLRDYVLRSTEQRFGPQPPHDDAKITSVFKAFAARWGSQAGPIARYAYEAQDGVWRSAPVTYARFTKGNDAHFATPISARLTDC